jgi:hypothetical protein
MKNYTIAVALCLAVAGALVAYAAKAPVSQTHAARVATVSPFDLMAKSRGLPAESFDTI